MANFNKHAKTGILVCGSAGLVINLIRQFDRMNNDHTAKFNWLELFAYTTVGATLGGAAGVLPDLFEPAINPCHRKIFHSMTLAFGIGAGIIKANKSKLPEPAKDAIKTASMGYITHLILDSKTPYGLPII